MQIIKNIQVNWSRVSSTVFSKHKAGLLEKASLGVIRNFRSEVTAWGDRISKYVVVNCLMEEYLDRMLICIWFRFLKNFDLMKSSKTTRWDRNLPFPGPFPKCRGVLGLCQIGTRRCRDLRLLPRRTSADSQSVRKVWDLNLGTQMWVRAFQAELSLLLQTPARVLPLLTRCEGFRISLCIFNLYKNLFWFFILVPYAIYPFRLIIIILPLIILNRSDVISLSH